MNFFLQRINVGACLAIIILSALALGSFNTYANEGSAEYVVIEDTDVKSGDIIILDNNKYKKAATPYDPHMVGIVTNEPAVAFGVSGKEGTKAVVTVGTVLTNVTAKNGNIESGDLITSSEVPGVGMKATSPGNVIGVARESFTPDSADTIGQVPVTLNIYFASTEMDNPTMQRSVAEHVRRALVAGAVAAATEPNTAFRYITAALIGIISLTFGFISSARSANNGITAIGRNPLAKRSIILGIVINIFITVIIAASGLALSAFLLAW